MGGIVSIAELVNYQPPHVFKVCEDWLEGSGCSTPVDFQTMCSHYDVKTVMLQEHI